MSADIINLRQAKKSRARSEKEKQAAHNRVQFGRNKAEKQLADSLNRLHRTKLDAHQREASIASDVTPQKDSET
jgi:Domain of unknown function (DUF4169)